MHDFDDPAAYDFALPDDRIAASPCSRRAASRLLDVASPTPVDRRFVDVLELLRPGDLLVVNDARVTPVRLHGRRATGGGVELFVLGFGSEGDWQDPRQPWVTFSRSNRAVADGEVIDVAGEAFTRIGRRDDGTTRWAPPPGADLEWLETAGAMPLPPYILKRRRAEGLDEEQAADRERYQTVFADVPGAVAAPTAGLHFDAPLLDALAAKGVGRATVSLLVGAGTFKPVSADRLSDHEMHRERYHVPDATIAAIDAARVAGGRIVAVGTTVVRTLEAWAAAGRPPGWGDTALFIRPGFGFRVVDAMITNFHLPRSTLLALVTAFAGYERVMRAYEHAVASEYRFYSYGDAMWLIREETP